MKFPEIDFISVKGVLLDLDNTLYHYESCHTQALNACYDKYKYQIDKGMLFIDFSKKYREKRDSITQRLSPSGACRSRLFAFQEMFEELNLNKSWELAYEYETIYWDIFIKNMTLAKDALIFLDNCKKLKINICIVSDMTANIQIRKLQKLKVSSYIKYLVTSEEVGEEKPSAKMFESALSKLNLSTEEVIMVGDSESKDIKGASALGIKSYKVQES